MAAYQANYGFTRDGDPDANKAAVSSTHPEASKPDSKLPEKEKPRDGAQDRNPDQHETPAKDTKQKGEKRKPEPGRVTTNRKLRKTSATSYIQIECWCF